MTSAVAGNPQIACKLENGEFDILRVYSAYNMVSKATLKI